MTFTLQYSYDYKNNFVIQFFRCLGLSLHLIWVVQSRYFYRLKASRCQFHQRFYVRIFLYERPFWQLFLVTFWLWQKNCTKKARVNVDEIDGRHRVSHIETEKGSQCVTASLFKSNKNFQDQIFNNLNNLKLLE